MTQLSTELNVRTVAIDMSCFSYLIEEIHRKLGNQNTLIDELEVEISNLQMMQNNNCENAPLSKSEKKLIKQQIELDKKKKQTLKQINTLEQQLQQIQKKCENHKGFEYTNYLNITNSQPQILNLDQQIVDEQFQVNELSENTSEDSYEILDDFEDDNEETEEIEEIDLDENMSRQENMQYLAKKLYKSGIKLQKNIFNVPTYSTIVQELIQDFKSNKINVILVKDGPCSPFRQLTLEKRKQEKQKQAEKMAKLKKISEEAETKIKAAKLIKQQEEDDFNILIDKLEKIQQQDTIFEEIQELEEVCLESDFEEINLDDSDFEEMDEIEISDNDQKLNCKSELKKKSKKQSKQKTNINKKEVKKATDKTLKQVQTLQKQLQQFQSQIQKIDKQSEQLTVTIKKARQVTISTAKQNLANSILLKAKQNEQKNNNKTVKYPIEALKALLNYSRDNNLIMLNSPSEADYQLAALNRTKIVDAILSNDSDQIILGCSLVINYTQNIQSYFLKYLDIFNLKILQKLQEQLPELSDIINKLQIQPKREYQFQCILNSLDKLATQVTSSSLGTGSLLLRRQRYLFIMTLGNDYISSIQQECPTLKIQQEELIALLMLIFNEDIDYSGQQSIKQCSIDKYFEFFKLPKDLLYSFVKNINLQLNKKLKVKLQQIIESNKILELLSGNLQNNQELELFIKIVDAYNSQNLTMVQNLQSLNQQQTQNFITYCNNILKDEQVNNIKFIVEQIQKCNSVSEYSNNSSIIAIQQLFIKYCKENSITVTKIDQKLTKTKKKTKKSKSQPSQSYTIQQFMNCRYNQHELFNDNRKQKDESNLLNFLETGKVVDKVQQNRIERFLLSAKSDLQIIQYLYKLNLCKQQVISQIEFEAWVQSKEVYFTGNKLYAELFASCLQIYESSQVYSPYRNKIMYLDEFYLDYASNPTAEWFKTCQQFNKEYVPSVKSQSVLGVPSQLPNLWNVSLFVALFGLQKKVTSIPPNSSFVFNCYLNTKIQNGAQTAQINIIKINGVTEENKDFIPMLNLFGFVGPSFKSQVQHKLKKETVMSVDMFK
ncbi:Conserved_hypothetical protein [Hexamita inflata]|uniref:XPG-I domain-containing protein n=1 Tax=Hexamita inflata TaxID=28002 RepID=A0AA86UCG9_9EUKA|nr:Conserved hypothetical protein [Hexamita inflata]